MSSDLLRRCHRPSTGRDDDDVNGAALSNRENTTVASLDVALKNAMSIEGATGVALVDYTSGMALGTMGGSKSST